MLTGRNIYIGAMALGGLALALASFRWPVIHDGPVPPLMSLLGVSLVFDLAIMSLAASGKADPLHMNTRLIGFFAGALIYFFLRMGVVG